MKENHPGFYTRPGDVKDIGCILSSRWKKPGYNEKLKEDLKDYHQSLNWMQTLGDESPFKLMHEKALQDKVSMLICRVDTSIIRPFKFILTNRFNIIQK